MKTTNSDSPTPEPATLPQGVPLLDLKCQHEPLMEEMVDALRGVCQSGAFVLGPEVTKLENNTADYCQAKHAVGCASGSDALLLAMMACDVGPGDEVILPSFTFFATASAVTRLGATPVFADIERDTFNISPVAIRACLNSATKAILPVHLFGQCADMDEINAIAQSAGIPVVEDAAQAIGAEWAGQRAGSIGQIGCFSYYPTKNLGGAGDGGMLTTNDDALADRLQLLRGHGMRPRYYHQVIGVNSRLDSFQAAILNIKMKHLDRYTEQRQENAACYARLFAEAGLDQQITLPPDGPNRRHVWNQYVVRVSGGQRDTLREHLSAAKIGSEIYYPLGLHDQECFKYLDYKKGDLPETDRAAEEVLALPIFPGLTAEQQKIVVDRIATFYEAAGRTNCTARPKAMGRANQRVAS